jgi:hypothetical protein
MGQADATVHGAVVQLAIAFFAQYHGTGATVAFAAAFFCSCAVKILSDNFQQHSICRYVIQLDTLAVFDESKSLA